MLDRVEAMICAEDYIYDRHAHLFLEALFAFTRTPTYRRLVPDHHIGYLDHQLAKTRFFVGLAFDIGERI